MTKMTLTATIALALSLTAATVAHAAPTLFFGENQTPSATVSGAPLTARTNFLASLSGVSSQGFEGFTTGTSAPLTLGFTGSGGTTLGATLTGSGSVADFAGSAGRFNTTAGGSKWWEVSGNFAISFATPISAFGFYGTDIGDFNGQVTLDLLDTTGAHTLLTVANTVNGNNGSLLFWGFVDSAKTYSQITFGNTNSGTDFFGFDDMVIGDTNQVCTVNCGTIPEPTSLALVGLGLFAAGMSARKARRA
jgi:hypothetical protein